MQLPCRIPCRTSTTLVWLLAIVHGGVAMALALLVAERRELLWFLAALWPLIVFSLAWQLRRLYGSRSVVSLMLRQDGAIDLQRKDGVLLQGRVLPQTTVISWLVVLLLRQENGRTLALTLLPDALAVDDFRQLRLWLRWMALGDETETASPQSVLGKLF